MFTSLSNAFDTLVAFQNAVENARRADYFGHATSCRGSNPCINLFEKGEDTILTAEIAGLKKEDIKIEIKEDNIRIAGKRKIDYPENASVHRVERRSFDFDRTLRLPHRVEPDKVTAEFQNGILKVVLPKAEKDKPKQIEIN
jgi:HSP20 family protein